MQLDGNTMLITGGSEGIGLALAKHLVNDNTVIVCGRSREKLARAQTEVPGLVTQSCDITDTAQRAAMIEHVLGTYPHLNVVFNNAGAKHRTELLSGKIPVEAMEADLALNFVAPTRLTLELLPHLRSRPQAAVINMTTGLVHLPKAAQTFYCAAKAAFRSFTQSLRWALRDTDVDVYEVLLTLVATNFHQGAVPDNIRAISAEAAAETTLKGIAKGKPEIAVGKAALAPWLAMLAPQRGMALTNK